jgi:hypothetical protein
MTAGYLPKAIDEPDDTYKARIANSSYQPNFNNDIRAFAGVFSSIALENETLASDWDDWLEDVDGCGSSIEVFLHELRCAAHRDAYSFVLCDYQKTPPAQNRAEELANKALPRWRHVDALCVINWLESDGKITQATILEQRVKEQLLFGQKLEQVYRVIRGDRWQLYRVVKRKEPKPDDVPWYNQLIEEGQFTGRSGQPLGVFPLIFFSSSYRTIGDADQSVFHGLAKMDRDYYQSSSELREKVRKIMCPIAVIAPGKGSQFAADPRDKDTQFVLGSNTLVRAGEGGRFSFEEPSGTSLKFASEELDKLQLAMNRYSLKLITDGQQRTATEIRLIFASTSNKISQFLQSEKSAIDLMFDVLKLQAGVDFGEYRINADITGLLTEPTELLQAFQAGAISQELFLSKFFPALTPEEVAEELGRIKAESEAKQEAAIELMAAKDPYSGDAPKEKE